MMFSRLRKHGSILKWGLRVYLLDCF
jgi:hypothetical protein